MNALHWFLDPIQKHYADFEGRVGRQEYWMFVLISVLIQVALDIVHLDMIGMLVSLGLLLPSLGWLLAASTISAKVVGGSCSDLFQLLDGLS